MDLKEAFFELETTAKASRIAFRKWQELQSNKEAIDEAKVAVSALEHEKSIVDLNQCLDKFYKELAKTKNEQLATEIAVKLDDLNIK